MEPPELKYEPSDFYAKGALCTGTVLVVSLVVIGALLFCFQRAAVLPASERNETPPPSTSPLAETEFESGKIRKELNGAAQAKLLGYAWVDHEGGVVRIPLEKAMEIVAKRPRKARP